MTLTSLSRTEPRTFLLKAQTGQDSKEGLIAASANSRLARGGTRATSIVISIIITGPQDRRQYDLRVPRTKRSTKVLSDYRITWNLLLQAKGFVDRIDRFAGGRQIRSSLICVR